MIVDFDTSVATLAQLRAFGVDAAIDDFGTGYSSLQHLHRLPIDQLKIDRGFIARLSSHESAGAIVRASVNIARDLGLGTVAEGIEDLPTLRDVHRYGCDEVQGYLVSRPVPALDLVRWASAWRPERLLAQLDDPRFDLPDPREGDMLSLHALVRAEDSSHHRTPTTTWSTTGTAS
jgi:EAL domain-containing protein (putative c-di-GMP-specific phosphodiesterase class I)